MKKLIGALAICFPLFVWAQPHPPRGDKERAEKVEALKIGFLTQRLDLTTDEAKSFWPVYNKFQDEMEKIRKQRRESFRRPEENFEGMSDSEIEKLVDTEITMRQNELDIIKKISSSV
jgi:hypothetical protein